MSEDPARDGINWYAYAANNPLTNVDPTGLDVGNPGNDGYDSNGNPTQVSGYTVTHSGDTTTVSISMAPGNATNEKQSASMQEHSSTPIPGVTKENITTTTITIKSDATVSTRTSVTPVLVIDPGKLFGFGATPEGRRVTRHYGLDTGPDRNIPGSVVDDVIDNNQGTPVAGGKTVYYDPDNNVTVVTGVWGSIVSVHKGPPGKGEK